MRLAAIVLALAALISPAGADEFVVTFGGDVNFARSHARPLPDRIRKFTTFSLEDATAALVPEWAEGDLNFVNVETVVSERNGALQPKTFVFRSHPDNFRHLMGHGVNAFALANNHAFDHGLTGLRDTRAFFEAEAAQRPIVFGGTGQGDAAFRPGITEVNGLRIALSALSFGSGAFSPSEGRVGMAYLSNRAHYQKVLDGLAEVEADLKILSLHTGTENFISLNQGQREQFLRGIREAGVQLVLGHHPHVVRAVEALPDQNAAIFYSLGNFLFIGGAAKDSQPLGEDYGLMGKAYFRTGPDGLELTALEALPLKGVHLIPRTLAPARAEATLRHLNRLSTRSVGETAAAFTPVGNRGIACYGGPYGPQAHPLCCQTERSLHCDLPDLM